MCGGSNVIGLMVKQLGGKISSYVLVDQIPIENILNCCQCDVTMFVVKINYVISLDGCASESEIHSFSHSDVSKTINVIETKFPMAKIPETGMLPKY